MIKTAAIRVTIKIFRRALVPLLVLPPYHAARKQQPITPALARSLSWKKATTLSNSHERPARLFMPSKSWSLRSVKRPASEIRMDKKTTEPVKSVSSRPASSLREKKSSKPTSCQKMAVRVCDFSRLLLSEERPGCCRDLTSRDLDCITQGNGLVLII